MSDDDWYGPDAATFGDRMAGAREQAGMSQAQLARRLGVKKGTIVAWEEDRSDPRANRLQMMSGLLNVSIIWLLTGEGDGPEPPQPEDPQSVGLAELAAELRELRSQMRANAEHAARIEKRLRTLMQEG
ncbi:helix-turn-helix domain-containing protein [Marinibacterium profundimaris]|uniref:XRE family transcriptional regulator n=1 Tax=Marinibacterium profundimaris TaxID=1679460 RepID=A0A225NGE8_9RHOB|nr:helix-turn-helix transcriptional regulator [Marinibacterium profundimaris]OWU72546.1 XRE family transcriptional regulator [Marinibacterium profundimaris]